MKHTLYMIWSGYVPGKKSWFDLTFVLYLVLQTSASLITNCTLVVIISNHMMLFYM